MIHFLYGENLYEVTRYKNAIQKKFKSLDTSGLNTDIFDGSNLTYQKFISAVSAMPFLCDRRLILIKNFLLENKDSSLKEKISQHLGNIPDTSVVAFVEMGEPDKRQKLFKALQKQKNTQHFPSLDDKNLNIWIRKKMLSENLKIDSDALLELISRTGADQFRLENEIQKISLYLREKKQTQISKEIIEKLIKSEVNPEIFPFIEALARRDKKSALKILKEYQEIGQSDQYLIAMIGYQLKTMLIIKDLLEKNTMPANIAKIAKINPYVVSKNISLVQKYSIKELISMYENLINSDISIKSGRVEPKTALFLLVAKLSG